MHPLGPEFPETIKMMCQNDDGALERPQIEPFIVVKRGLDVSKSLNEF